MEMALSAKDSEWSERLTRELSSLQNQLQAHEHTTSILVAEKAELSTALDQNQHLLQQKAGDFSYHLKLIFLVFVLYSENEQSLINETLNCIF